MNRIINILKPIVIAGLVSASFSLFIVRTFPHSPQNLHWVYSLSFHAAVALTIGILGMFNTDAKTLASNIMSVSMARLIVSAVAFLIYRTQFPQFQKWFVVHFMIHYVLFTFFEILFLLKIVNTKTSGK